MHFLELENLPPQKQLTRFLKLAFQKQGSTPAELAEKLGYARDTMVVQWMKGTANVPLRQVSAIGQFFECEASGYALTALRRKLDGLPGLRVEPLVPAVDSLHRVDTRCSPRSMIS